jgi:long-chain acyl-CoA synthetase
MNRNTAAFRFFLSLSGAHEKMKNLLLGRTPQFKRRIVFFDMLVSFIPFLLLSPFRGLANIFVFRKVRKTLGGRLTGVSGGAALPEIVDKFYAAIGIKVLEGYGLTETAPILAVRRYNHPVPLTIGPAFPDMEVTIRDPETGKEQPPMKEGNICARGNQVMKGYYKRPEDTAKIIDGEGWLNTGDIAMKTFKGEIKFTGRSKDIIVLMRGENVSPIQIENKIRNSVYISNSVVVGQDQKYLAALVLPNMERVEAYAREKAISYSDIGQLLKNEKINELIMSEINAQVNVENGFKKYELIARCHLISKQFEVGAELSGKKDYRRHVIAQMYKKEIAQMFAE